MVFVYLGFIEATDSSNKLSLGSAAEAKPVNIYIYIYIKGGHQYKNHKKDIRLRTGGGRAFFCRTLSDIGSFEKNIRAKNQGRF